MYARLKTFFATPGTGFRAPQRIFWIGLVVRLLYITLAHTYRVRVILDHFQFGWEAGRIARAVATGHGYADPFLGPSGPTTWIPPLFPLVLAGVFKLFGVYTAISAWMILAIDSVFSAAHLARRLRDRRPLLRLAHLEAPRSLSHRALVRLALGALSRRHPVLRPLDLGHVDHHLPLRVDAGGRAPGARRRRLPCPAGSRIAKPPDHPPLGRLRPALGPDRPLEPLAADLPSRLRPLDGLGHAPHPALAREDHREGRARRAPRRRLPRARGSGATGAPSTPSSPPAATSAPSSTSPRWSRTTASPGDRPCRSPSMRPSSSATRPWARSPT